MSILRTKNNHDKLVKMYDEGYDWSDIFKYIIDNNLSINCDYATLKCTVKDSKNESILTFKEDSLLLIEAFDIVKSFYTPKLNHPIIDNPSSECLINPIKNKFHKL